MSVWQDGLKIYQQGDVRLDSEAAIKWIKIIKEKRSDFRDYTGEKELQGAIKMFKHFFNINEEELDIR